MTEPHPDVDGDGVEPVSVAELLARNGTLGAPAVTRRRRRRRGDNDAVSVAELTGELPVIRDDETELSAAGPVEVAEPATSGAEEMKPDPLDDPVDEIAVDEFPEDEFPEDEFPVDESAAAEEIAAGEAAEDHTGDPDAEVQDAGSATEAEARPGVSVRGRIAALRQSNLIVLESILAVAFGAGLFISFDQLWRWNSLVALMLSVLVILGLVAGVRVVRKTEDIASTLIAVAVGALITLGPLALSLRSG